MTVKKIIDAHCHFFNGQYAIMELAAATWNIICNNYPHKKGIGKYQKTRNSVLALDGVRNFALWTARLIKAVNSDCEGNYLYDCREFHESCFGEESSLVVTPLMMDIYFALDDNMENSKLNAKQQRILFRPFFVHEKQKNDFEEHFNNIKKMITEEFQKLSIENTQAFRKSSPVMEIESIFEDARNALMNISKNILDWYSLTGIELSPGYKKHMHDLERLSKKYPGKIFPFLAADPRRIGIMKLIDRKINKGNGVFKGLKIYPPLGYLPTDPKLIPIFDYCSKYDIPITIHCSSGGFPNLIAENYVTSWDIESHLENFSSVNGNKSVYYANPENWIPVLNRWPALRINFGHFGGGNSQWRDIIIKLMEDHPNIYADTGYFTSNGIALEINDIVNRNEILKKRLMFGTDYVMIMLDLKLGGLEAYYNIYSGLNENLLYENAKNFLKIKSL